jgi:hypothetical protein
MHAIRLGKQALGFLVEHPHTCTAKDFQSGQVNLLTLIRIQKAEARLNHDINCS